MGVRVLELAAGGAVLSTSDKAWAFGPIFNNPDCAHEFLKWLRSDPRLLREEDLEVRYYEWLDGAHKNAYNKEEA